MLLTDTSPQEKLAIFDQETNIWSLLILPLVIGSLVAATAPWIRYFFEYISQKPFSKLDILQLQAQHKATIEQTKLEQSRAELFSLREEELIQQAKRDKEVAEFSDDETKEKLKSELNLLRSKHNKLSHSNDFSFSPSKTKNHQLDAIKIAAQISNSSEEILFSASENERGNVFISRTLDGQSIKAGTNIFGAENNKSFAMYEDAIEELVFFKLLKPRGDSGETFELSHKGWEVSKLI